MCPSLESCQVAWAPCDPNSRYPSHPHPHARVAVECKMRPKCLFSGAAFWQQSDMHPALWGAIGQTTEGWHPRPDAALAGAGHYCPNHSRKARFYFSGLIFRPIFRTPVMSYSVAPICTKLDD